MHDKRIISIILIVAFITTFAFFAKNNAGAETANNPKDVVTKLFNFRKAAANNVDFKHLLNIKPDYEHTFGKYFVSGSEARKFFYNFLYYTYGPMEGFEKFSIVNVTPYYKIYKIDEGNNYAVAYIEEIFICNVKEKSNIKVNKNIPKEWIVPNENGVWMSGADSYFTVVLKKDKQNWKIYKIISPNNSSSLDNTSSLFAKPDDFTFSQPPVVRCNLPTKIEKKLSEIKNSLIITNTYSVNDAHRRWASMYATYWWNRRNTPQYQSYSNDCANFVSQCLYEAGFSMDTLRDHNLNENRNGFSQEWHINQYGNYNPSLSWTWVPCLDYYALNNWDYTWCGFLGELTSYNNLKIGDIVDLDGADGSNPNGTPDHIGIVVNFSPNGTPLIAAHSNDVYNACWEYPSVGVLYHCITLDYSYEN